MATHRGIRPWFDFTSDVYITLYGDIVKQESKSLLPPVPLKPIETVIFSERELEMDPLKRDIVQRVNDCLIATYKVMRKTDPTLDLGDAPVLACGTKYQANWGQSTPDWVGTQTGSNERFVCGETKLSTVIIMENLIKNPQNESLQKPLRQCLYYCIEAGTRYGYIVTNYELVALRWNSEEADSGIALDRPRRATTSIRHSFESSSLDESMATMSFSDRSYEGKHYFAEYCVIPWQQNDKHHLTIARALYLLTMIAYAPTGDKKITNNYEPLDRWHKLDGHYWNNTSGRVRKVLKKGQIEILAWTVGIDSEGHEYFFTASASTYIQQKLGPQGIYYYDYYNHTSVWGEPLGKHSPRHFLSFTNSGNPSGNICASR